MFAPGTTVGRYAIQRQLGEGSFGTVFLALHVSLHSLHAVKVLKPELARDPDVRERFLAEGRIQAQIAHPHLVRVTDILEEPSPALVMDFVDGKTLDEWLSGLGRALRADEVLGILVPVLDAVGAVHARGVVHRDIKPENIIISRDSSGRLRPVLSDFGIAKLQQDTTVSAVKRRTELGSSIGTPEYMSPEQVRGRDEIDARSDIFAIGVVAYELVAGRHPFADVDTFETKRNIVEGRYVPLGTPVSHAVADAVHRALAVDRAARYPDCESFHRAIELAYGDEPTQSTSGVYRIPEGSGTRQRRPNGPPAVNVPRPAQGGQSPPAPPPPPEARPVSPSSPGPVPGAGGSPPPREGARTGLLLFGGVAALLLVAGGLAVVGLVVARRLGSTPPVTAPAPSRAPVAAPAPSPVPVAGPASGGPARARVAPGEFEMGTASDRPGYFKDDQLHRVRITRAFEIGTHEVTQREWTAEMGSLPPGLQADADLPVLGVSWTDAVAFCNRLSSRLDLPEAYRSDGDRWVASGEHGGFRLPTEAEWEFAARAATDSPFAGGSDALLVAWFAGSAGGRPRPVGSLGANALGLFDMSGNAAEWVWDVYQPYPSADVVDPRADEGGDRRVIRGGSYADSEDKLRVTYRRAALPTDTPPTIGFRVARDAR